MFCLCFFVRGRRFVTLHKRVLHQMGKQEEMTLYLPGPTLSRSFVRCNFIHQLFGKVFCNILIEKVPNYSPRTGFLALYMSLFKNNYWCAKNTVFFVFAACDKYPLSRSFTSTHFPGHFLLVL